MVPAIKKAEIRKSKKMIANLGAEYPKMKELSSSRGMINKTARFRMLSKLMTRKNNLI
jgi:hypothetical protein